MRGLNSAVVATVLGVGSFAFADFEVARTAYKSGQYEVAAREFRKSAELGHSAAQFNLGAMYYRGEGVERNIDLAFAWTFLAAENSLPDARATLEHMKSEISPKALTTLQGIRAQYGKAALELRLQPQAASLDANAGQQYHSDWTMSDTDNAAVAMVLHRCRFEAKNISIETNLAENARVNIVGFQAFVANVYFAADGSAREIEHLFTYPRKYLSRDEIACLTKLRISASTGQNRAARSMRLEWHSGTVRPAKFFIAFDNGETPAQTSRRIGREILPCAREGSPSCQFLAAMLPFTDEDRGSQAADMLLRSAQGDYAPAQYVYAKYLESLGHWNENQAQTWLELAYANKSAAAAVALARRAVSDAKQLDWRRAKALLEEAQDAKDFGATVPLAALLAASPDQSLRDPERARSLLDKVRFLRGDDPVVLEIEAAAAASLGDFRTAHEMQDKAIILAKKVQWSTALLEERRVRYASKQAWFGDLLRY